MDESEIETVMKILVDNYSIIGAETARDVIGEWLAQFTDQPYHAADALMTLLDKNDVRFISVPELTSLVASEQSPEPDEKVTVFMHGGPWQGQSFAVDRVGAPVFAVGHPIGGRYWLDAKSDPPTYHWGQSHE